MDQPPHSRFTQTLSVLLSKIGPDKTEQHIHAAVDFYLKNAHHGLNGRLQPMLPVDQIESVPVFAKKMAA